MATVGNYRIKKMIAEGGFARIYQAEHILLNGKKACIKQSRVNSPDYMDLLKQEAEILWDLDEHHSIPHVKDLIEIKRGIYVMVMKYIDGRTIDDLLPKNSRLHPEDVCWITERLLGALYYCHYNGYVHGDIKPANVIVEEKKHDIKLIDFGLSVYKPVSATKPPGYTEAFVAPEIKEGKPPIPETDLYGVGLTMLYALGGNPLIKTIPDKVPLPIKEFYDSLLKYDPIDRPNWEKVNLVERLSDLRLEVFGKRHSEVHTKNKLD